MTFPHPKTWNLIGKPPYQSSNFDQECSTETKTFFCVIAQHWCIATFFLKIKWFFLKIKTRLLVSETEKIIPVNHLLIWSCQVCHAQWKLVSLRGSSQDVLSSTQIISVEIKSPVGGLFNEALKRGPRWGCQRWMGDGREN